MRGNFPANPVRQAEKPKIRFSTVHGESNRCKRINNMEWGHTGTGQQRHCLFICYLNISRDQGTQHSTLRFHQVKSSQASQLAHLFTL